MPIQVASTDHPSTASVTANNGAQQPLRRSPRHTPPTPPAAVDAASSPLRRSPRLAANNAARNAANDDAHYATQSSTADAATRCTTRCSAACASAAAAGDLRYSGVRKKCNPTKAADEVPDDDLMVQQIDYFLDIGELPYCQKMDGNAKGWCKCNCLSVFRGNEEICTTVARFCIDFWKSEKLTQDQTIIDWIRYAQMSGFESGYGSKYLLPYASDGEEDPINLQKIRSTKICTSALCTVIGISGSTHTRLRKLASTTGCAKVHGMKGKKNRKYKDDSEEMMGLKTHMDTLVGFGEVRATRMVKKLVNGTNMLTTRDDNDENIYLPSCNGYRSCYNRYLRTIGFKVWRTLGSDFKISLLRSFREADKAAAVIPQKCRKRNWWTTLPERNHANEAEASLKRVDDLKEMCDERDKLTVVKPPGLNPYKVVEMWSNFRPLVPLDKKDDILYREPTADEWAVVKKEKKMNKEKKVEVKKMKRETMETEDEVVGDDTRKAKKPRTTDSSVPNAV